MRARRAIIVPLDSQERFEDLDVDVFRGNAKFISPHEVEVNGQVLKGKNLVVTSGSSAEIPLIPDLGHLTSAIEDIETITPFTTIRLT